MQQSWFKDEKKVEIKEEKEPIKDYSKLRVTYNDTMHKFQFTTDSSVGEIGPIVNELMGAGGGPKDMGDIGRLRHLLNDTRYLRTSTGALTLKILDEIEGLSGWESRYSEHLLEYMDGMSYICKSAFGIIEDRMKLIEQMDVHIQQMEEQIQKLTEESMEEKEKGVELESELEIAKESEPERPFNEERKEELMEVYNECKDIMDFITLVNPKINPNNLTPKEREYLKEINQSLRKFKGVKRDRSKGKKIEPEK